MYQLYQYYHTVKRELCMSQIIITLQGWSSPLPPCWLAILIIAFSTVATKSTSCMWLVTLFYTDIKAVIGYLWSLEEIVCGRFVWRATWLWDQTLGGSTHLLSPLPHPLSAFKVAATIPLSFQVCAKITRIVFLALLEWVCKRMTVTITKQHEWIVCSPACGWFNPSIWCSKGRCL